MQLYLYLARLEKREYRVSMVLSIHLSACVRFWVICCSSSITFGMCKLFSGVHGALQQQPTTLSAVSLISFKYVIKEDFEV